MAKNTKIEWTEITWNPVTGCTKVSAGCKNCYAERMAFRLQAMGVFRYRNAFHITMHNDLIDLPRSWKRPSLVFVNSMSDLFHEDIPSDFIYQIFDSMARCPQHIFQVLTKRSNRLKELSPHLPWKKNIWIGVTIENKQVTDRIRDLITVPAAIRFLSCEPLLDELGNLDLRGINWVIVGGESGPGSRPMNPSWVDSLYAQCLEYHVPFFFKQWGGTRKRQNGRELHGKIYSEMPFIEKTNELQLLSHFQ
jgi:protein gp37